MSKSTFRKAASQLCVLVLAVCLQTGFANELSLDTTFCGIENSTRIACNNASNLLYVTSPTQHEIIVLDFAGSELNSIATPGVVGAVCTAEDGFLIVSVGSSVMKITMTGEVVTTYGLVSDYFVGPHDVLWVPDGRVFVADDDDQIKVFDNAGAPLFTFGSYGYFNGRFDEPVAMDYNPITNQIIVTDQNNYRFQSFTLAGTLVNHWGIEGNGLYTNGSYFRAFGIDVDEAGKIWTFDVLLDLVQVYDSAGTFLYSMSLNTPEIRGGVDIAVDQDKLFVTSPSTSCVFAYDVLGNGRAETHAAYDLTIQWTAEGIQLNWRPIPGAVSYTVERSTDSDFSEGATDAIGPIMEHTYVDTQIAPARIVNYYRVIAETNLNDHSSSVGGDSQWTRLGDGRYRDPLDTEHDSPHHVTHGVNCNSCHLRPYIYPSPRPEWWFSDHLCKSCHVETGFAKAVQTHLGGDTLTCNVCHSPHYHQPQFERYFIRNENPMGESNGMFFNNATDFVHGAPNFDGICEICHTQTNYYRNDGSDGGTHNTGSNCITCHKHENGFKPVGGGACNACHGAPPDNGAHRAHFGGTVEQASYGTVQNFSTDSAYVFSCGTCHPSSSSSFHQNGTVDVELYDATAPSGSLKSLNPPTAQYEETSGSCSNVYCHSATTWSSGDVGSPLTQTNGLPILDGNRNLTYAPYEISETRAYSTVNWNGGSLDCNGCHRNGPQTSVPTVRAGVGNSHGWIDDWGYEDLHAYNMASDPLTCRTCHYETVMDDQTWSRDNWDITTYDDVAIVSKATHVNGHKSVQFDPIDTFSVQDLNVSLANATYDENSRTCSGVPCHLTQETPQWGKPYRWWEELECDQCHNYSGAFGQRITLESDHEPVNGQPCTRCHDPHPHG